MSYPTTPEATSVQITAVSKNVRTEARNGRVQVRSLADQRWAITMTYRDLTRSDFGPVFGFVAGKSIGGQTFTVSPSEVSSADGVSGSASATAALGATSVSVSGFSGTLKAGSFVKFSTHDKVYMVTADRTGGGTMTITPPLQESISGSMTYNDVPFTVRLVRDIQEWTLGGYDRYSFEVDMLEA